MQVRTGAKVTAVTAEGVVLASGETLPAELVVWAAGVKASDFLKDLAGLETNRLNQLVVGSTLQSTRDERIYAIGDCGAAPWLGRESVGGAGMCVPPRAQRAANARSTFSRIWAASPNAVSACLTRAKLWPASIAPPDRALSATNNRSQYQLFAAVFGLLIFSSAK